jgi:hypothetical protein
MRLQRATERFNLYLQPTLHLEHFSDRRFSRSDDQGISAEGVWLWERSNLDISTLLRDQSTLTSELLSTGIFDFNTRRRDEEVNASWSYGYTERRVFSLTAGYQNSRYHGDVSNTLLQDSQYSTVGASERFVVTPRLSFSVSASVGRYQSPDSVFSSRSDSLETGLVVQASERTRVSAQLGVNRRSDQLSSENGFVGELSIAHNSQTGGFNLSAGRSVAPSGFGVFTQTDQAQLDMSRALSERLTLSSTLTAFRTTSAFRFFTLADRTYEQARLGLSWQADEQWSLGASAGLNRAESQLIPGTPHGWQVVLQSVWRPKPRSISR